MFHYLDNAATTPVRPEAAQAALEAMTEGWGNPSSQYALGKQAAERMKSWRADLAGALGCEAGEVFFTSCGSESDNWAVLGALHLNRRAGKHILTTAIEHAAVLEPIKALERQGYEVTYLQPGRRGEIDPAQAAAALRPDTALVYMMLVNNELGTVLPVKELFRAVRTAGCPALLHCDAVQGFLKVPFTPKELGADLLSVSGHKIHGPKGVGFLYAGEKVKLHPIVFGGGQQNGLRSGTENVPGIAGLGLACQKVYETLEEDSERMYRLREKLIEGVADIGNIQINGCPGREGAPHVVSISFRGVRSEVLLHALEDRGICVSAGSACAAKHPRPSETLKAIGVERPLLESTLRFSLSLFTTEEEIVYTLHTLHEIVPVLRRYSRY